MANLMFTKATELLLSGSLDFANDDIRIALVDATTTAVADRDAATLSGISTLGEIAGTGYVRKVLANTVVNRDDPNNQSEFDADDVLWSAINAGTAVAAIIYKHVTNDTDSIPLIYIDEGDFPIVTNGSDATIVWDAEGIMKVTTV